MTTSRWSILGVLLALWWAGSLEAQRLGNAWTSPCTLSVVLVTFKDTTARHEGAANVPADRYNYHDHDLPHGYRVNRDGALVPGTSSYKTTVGALPRGRGTWPGHDL
ncbi:MAG: hypothetical protein OXG13_07345 [Gemmatimonadaceae bacterium]|nr:hypothetical protein [Gemmatimonadaceae bacterium]